ncbi:MAG: pilin [Patescibacteria group bacterium]
MNTKCIVKKIVVFAYCFIVLFSISISSAYAGVSYTFQVPFPGLSETIQLCEANQALLSCGGITKYIVAVYEWIIKLAVVLAVLIVTLAGLRWMFARGDTGAITEARKMISNTFIGLVLAFGSYVFLFAINPKLVTFGPMGLAAIEREELEIEQTPIESPNFEEIQQTPIDVPGGIKDRINQNMALYKQVAQMTNIPWELIATTHYQEAGNRGDKSILNGFAICNASDSKCPECASGKTQLNDARCAARVMKEKAQERYPSFSNYTDRSTTFALTEATNDGTDSHGAIANILFRYNGVCPHKSLEDLSVRGTCLNVDESAYVMNNFSADPRYQRMGFAGYVANDCKPGCTVFKHWSTDGGLRFFQRLKNPANFDGTGKLVKMD